ncbi:hypothetical protein L1887_28722 [Cichorium endivia]|nr:hypothetical protein L1887_28722 [Cichorium endivia]
MASSSTTSSHKRLKSSTPSSPKRLKYDGSSSTPSIQKRFKYDVFLSFRGEDTRKTFVDHLYRALDQKGIRTYKDDEKITKGNKICDELIRSIEDSKLYIIVFSKTYASSSWCLDELVKIMECHKTSEHTAFPIFYDVEPTDVRKQSGAVGKAFAKHENKETAAKWREALKEAADLAGWELKNTADGHEAKFIQKIIEDLSPKLRDINFIIDENLVGMDTRINNVLSSLEIGIVDVRMIGIKGLGGGGKTTLARVIFDQISYQFEGKSFVENVREVSKASVSGLKSLQKQILSDVLKDKGIKISSVYDGKNMMKRRMLGKKVLIVLDDVDHIEQLEALAGKTNWFKSGSRIIITTRDEQVLIAHRVKSIYNIHLLLDVEAIRLFSRYAFERVIPDLGYEELSEQVVHYAAGLPLTIKVLGSFLCGKTKPEWIDALKRLKEIPEMETLKKLEISYISLEPEYKEIFLNLACMLKGWSKAMAIEALESCGFHAINGIKVLQQKSLITIDNCFWREECVNMHDHIEEMGKNIVRRLHPNKPNKHSRLWIQEEIEDILTNDLGTKATRYISFYTNDISRDIAMKGLQKMKELIYLGVDEEDMDATITDGSCDSWKVYEFSNALQYLNWQNYPFRDIPKTFQADNLVALLMSRSRIEQLWEGGERKVLKKLRFLDLSYSCLKTLDLGLAPNLETLDLGGCKDLIELRFPHKCENLKSLKLNNIQVKTLDIGETPNLEYLNLSDYDALEEFHMADGCLKKVVCLDLSGCLRFSDFRFHIESNTSYYAPVNHIRYIYFNDLDDASSSEDEPLEGDLLAELHLHLISESQDGCTFHPDSDLPKFKFKCDYKEYQPLLTRNLEKLISVGPCACTNLDMFSRSICGLEHLRKLKLTGDIPEPPKDLDKLGCLEKLEFSHTDIKHLPDNICMLKHLKSLKVESCLLLKRLPENLGQLECLKKLTLTRVTVKDLPDSICMLKDLESLKLRCLLLEKLPEDIGRLERLKKIKLSSGKIKELPARICMLKHLGSLELSCLLLDKLPKDLGRLECLEKLELRYCESLRDIPDNICNIKCLKQLHLCWCNRVETLPKELGSLKGLRIVAPISLLQSYGLETFYHMEKRNSLCNCSHIRF